MGTRNTAMKTWTSPLESTLYFLERLLFLPPFSGHRSLEIEARFSVSAGKKWDTSPQEEEKEEEKEEEVQLPQQKVEMAFFSFGPSGTDGRSGKTANQNNFFCFFLPMF